MKCPLCDLENIEKQKFLETDTEYVIYNKWAATEGQCLVIPKRHVETIRDLSEVELINLIKTVQKVSEILNYHLNPEGFNYGFNEKSLAGQHFNHLHFHIIPRFKNDNISNNLIPKPKTIKKLSDEELKSYVRKCKLFFE